MNNTQLLLDYVAATAEAKAAEERREALRREILTRAANGKLRGRGIEAHVVTTHYPEATITRKAHDRNMINVRRFA